jgi:hypothetical protein
MVWLLIAKYAPRREQEGMSPGTNETIFQNEKRPAGLQGAWLAQKYY